MQGRGGGGYPVCRPLCPSGLHLETKKRRETEMVTNGANLGQLGAQTWAQTWASMGTRDTHGSKWDVRSHRLTVALPCGYPSSRAPGVSTYPSTARS